MELWLVDLDAAAPALEALEREMPRLSADERARARRLKEPRERRQRLAAYMALRIAIERIGGAGIGRKPFTRTASGKPHLGAAAPSFSLAHTAGLALVGVARGQTIGVDLERHRGLSLSPRRRQEILAVGAGLALQALHAGAGDAPVLQAWCRLEAFAKATGRGVARILTQLGVRAARGRQLAPVEIEAAARRLARADGLAVGDVQLPAGLYGAVACTGLSTPPRVRRFPAEEPAIRRLLSSTRPRRRSPPSPVAGGQRLR
jgi:4'-phosphopantetheinyl transferase